MNRMLIYMQEKFFDKKTSSYVMWNEIFICIIGFMVGRISVFSGWNPLCIAYVGATYKTKTLTKVNTLFVILGILLASNNMFMSIKYIGSILLILLIRRYMATMNYKSNLMGQAFISTISTLVIGILMLIIKGFTPYYFMQLLIEAALIFSIVFIYNKGTEVILDRDKNPLTHKQAIGLTLVVVSIIGGMIELYIEFSPGNRVYIRDIICFFLILAISYLGSASAGAAMGTVIGTLLVVIGYIPPHFISIYALAGLGGGILAPLGKVSSAIGGLTGHVVGIYLINNGIVDMSLIGAYIFGAITFLLCPKDFFGFSHWFGENGKEAEQEIHMNRIKKLTTNKLEEFALAFQGLSRTFNSMSIKKTSFTQKDISYLFEDVVENVCKDCSLYKHCWEKDFYNTYQSAYSILEKVEHKNQIYPSDVPEKFKKGCIRIEQFVGSVNHEFELSKQELICHNRLIESRELIGEQLRSVSDSIESLSKEIDEKSVFKRDLEKEVKSQLGSKGIKIKEIIMLYNSNQKYEVSIIINKDLENNDCHKIILSTLKEILDINFKLAYTKSTRDLKDNIIKIDEASNYGIVVGASSESKTENTCGDQYSAMEISQEQYLLALSDGMGSGPEASLESTAAIELLEEFIKAGFDRKTAVKMINSALILKSTNESFTTMDISIIDLYTGVAEFIKIGAATTFVKRKGFTEVIRANSLPVGILRKVDLEIQKRQLQDGDIIIMVTDGILDVEKDKFNQEDTFINLIEEIDSNNPQYIADTLLEKSQNLICGEINDDMTIIVARIWGTKYKN